MNYAVIGAAAHGIIMATDRTMLKCNGGHIEIKDGWIRSFAKRMRLRKRKATGARKALTEQEFNAIKVDFHQRIGTLVQAHAIPINLIINFDQTAIPLVPAPQWTLDELGTKQVKIVGINDKHNITGKVAAA